MKASFPVTLADYIRKPRYPGVGAGTSTLLAQLYLYLKRRGVEHPRQLPQTAVRQKSRTVLVANDLSLSQ